MFRVLFVFALFVSLLAGGGWFWSGGRWDYFTNTSAPEISLSRATGGNSKRFVVNLSAKDTFGLTGLKIVVEQGGKTVELSADGFTPAVPSLSREIEIEPKKLELAEGTAKVIASAANGTFSAKSSAAELSFLIDYSPPTVSVISQQFTANQGGTEFLLYRAGGGEITRTGVEIGDLFFRGYPGEAFDPKLAAQPGLYGALIAMPLGFDSTRTKITVVVEDPSGNIAREVVTFPIRPLKQADVNSKLSIGFLDAKLPTLSESFENRTGERLSETIESANEKIERFRLINERYRGLLQQEMFTLIDNSEPKKLWSGVFSRPIPGSTTSLFGERRSYSLDGAAAGGSLHEGLDLASVKNDIVKAVNSGVVKFAGEFGIYGETVIIDHGLGLFSLYGHLSSISAQNGASVSKDEEIGRTGTSGLAGGDHLHFEFRVGHVSVNPIEWWDQKWIADNIDGKITAVLEPAR